MVKIACFMTPKETFWKLFLPFGNEIETLGDLGHYGAYYAVKILYLTSALLQYMYVLAISRQIRARIASRTCTKLLEFAFFNNPTTYTWKKALLIAVVSSQVKEMSC